MQQYQLENKILKYHLLNWEEKYNVPQNEFNKIYTISFRRKLWNYIKNISEYNWKTPSML